MKTTISSSSIKNQYNVVAPAGFLENEFSHVHAFFCYDIVHTTQQNRKSFSREQNSIELNWYKNQKTIFWVSYLNIFWTLKTMSLKCIYVLYCSSIVFENVLKSLILRYFCFENIWFLNIVNLTNNQGTEQQKIFWNAKCRSSSKSRTKIKCPLILVFW